MTLPRVYKTEAIILKEARLGEADRLLLLFTPHRGKLRAVARGALRPKSRLAGHLQVFSHSLLMLARGRNLDIITGGQLISPFSPLREDLMRMSRGFYLVDLVNSFSPENLENRPLFYLLQNCLKWLCQAREGERVLRYFEIQLLAHLGFRPELGRCLSCRRALEPVTNFFSPAAGGMLCPGCAPTQALAQPLSVNALKMIRLLQSGDVATLSRLKIPPQLSAEVEGAMRDYICYLLEGEVKSAAWLGRLRHELARENS